MDTRGDPQKDLACLPSDLAADLDNDIHDTEEDQLSPDQVAHLTGISDIVGDASQTPIASYDNLDNKFSQMSLANSKPFKP